MKSRLTDSQRVTFGRQIAEIMFGLGYKSFTSDDVKSTTGRSESLAAIVRSLCELSNLPFAKCGFTIASTLRTVGRFNETTTLVDRGCVHPDGSDATGCPSRFFFLPIEQPKPVEAAKSADPSDTDRVIAAINDAARRIVEAMERVWK